MILYRRPLWMDSEQKKAKLSMGYSPTNSNTEYHRLFIQSLYNR